MALALALLIDGCAKVEDGKGQVKSTGSNPFLWQSGYDVADIEVAGTFSKGSGTAPTIIGTGPGQDKLVIIADFGDPVKVVAFTASVYF